MRKIIFLFAVLGLFLPVHSFFPFVYGARSLALGYSSLAFNYDVNALYINPSLLTSLSAAMGGFQYQNSFLDYRDISGRLSGIDIHDLEDFAGLDAGRQAALLAELNEVFAAQSPIHGFQMRGPGYAGKGYAIAVATVDAALIQPLANPVLGKLPAEITNADIASLSMKLIGFHYTDYSLAVAMPVSRGIALGATVHYLKGENTVFNAALIAEPFRSGATARDLLRAVWSGAENGFAKLNLDLGASAEFGQFFKAGIVARNVGNPVIGTDGGDLRLARRLVAGLAFRPRRPDRDLPGHRHRPRRPLFQRPGRPAGLARPGKRPFPEPAAPAGRFPERPGREVFPGYQGQRPLRAGLRFQPGKLPVRSRPGPGPAGTREKSRDFGILHAEVKKLTIEISFTTI